MKKQFFSFLAILILSANLTATEASNQWIEEYITNVPNFPKPGIQFKCYEMNLPFVMIRKEGKLPRKVEKIDYELEYGKTSFEIEVDSINQGDKVLIVDDLLATGGTAKAAATLVERLGGQVIEVACLIELEGLHGRENLKHPFYSLISIEVHE